MRKIRRGVMSKSGISLVLAAAVLLAGCGSSAVPDKASGSANWTTLGTRAQPSRTGTSITRNAGAQWVDYNPPALYPKTVSQGTQYITMPDGTQLAAYVTLPADASGKAAAGTFPTVLIQTSYNGGSAGLGVSALGGADPFIVQHGYATVVVDVRGTGQSQGNWEAFGATEQGDYADVVTWVTQQSWSNGAIGVYGVSYLGITAILTASQNHPSVKAAFPIVPIGDGYRDIVFTGGQVNPTFIPIWLGLVSVLGLTDPILLTDPQVGVATVLQHLLSAVGNFQVPTILQALAGNPGTAYDGDFWRLRSPLETDGKITVPTFIVGGLHDLFQRSEPLSYESVKTQVPAKLLIGPWTHLQAAMGDGLPVDGVPPLNHIELQWFDQYVKGLNVGADKLPNVTQYVLGHGHYVTATDWPHPQAQAQKLYLRGDKSLSASAPAAGEASNTTVQEPLNGLCSISTSQWTAGITGYAPLPCQTDDSVAELTDVVYETAPMAADTYINGPIEVDVWMSTTASDAGLSVRIDDVDGSTVTALTNGIQTASLRAVDASRSRMMNGLMIQPWHPFTQASVQAVGSGTPVLVPVEVFQTSALIAKGHKLRVAIGASDLPQGVPPAPTLLNSLLGALTIYSDAAHPSSVVLPVVPATALQ
ncbi:MAG: CocE/NonD family hydrolase [Nevskiaceae bacterium]|nr:MAG: CocE/NonD family hydrolase [Nevskiaceae bacterium]